MKLIITAIILTITVLPCFAVASDTLRCDTIMNVYGVNLMFKGGTVIKTNSKNEVVEGVLANDIDLWTTGPLVYFAGGHHIKFNENGKVYFGFPAVNFIAQACNGVFYEFKALSRIDFNNKGLVTEGTVEHQFLYLCRDGSEVFSMNGGVVKFYPDGSIMQLSPSENVKLSINANVKILFMGHKFVIFNTDGYVSQGTLARKSTLTTQHGTTVTKLQGEMVTFDSNGMLIE